MERILKLAAGLEEKCMCDYMFIVDAGTMSGSCHLNRIVASRVVGTVSLEKQTCLHGSTVLNGAPQSFFKSLYNHCGML